MKKLQYSLIVSDFDGTLANRDGEVSLQNKRAIERYIDAGGIFAISSGRLPAATLPHAKALGLRGLLCCGQGTVILDIESQEILFEARLSLEATLAACRLMEKLGLHILAFDRWTYYSNRDDEWLRLYEQVSGVKATPVTDRKMSEFLEEEQLCVYKLLAIVDPKDNAEVLRNLRAEKPQGCEVTKSLDVLVELVNDRYSKGSAVAFLAEHYGIPIERTVAIGDNYNDISMIERAGVGVAVANAEDALKSRADYVCRHTNDEDAVAEVIQKFGFGED